MSQISTVSYTSRSIRFNPLPVLVRITLLLIEADIMGLLVRFQLGIPTAKWADPAHSL